MAGRIWIGHELLRLEDIGSECRRAEAGENLHRGHEERAAVGKVLLDGILLGGGNGVRYPETVIHPPHHDAIGTEIAKGRKRPRGGVPNFIGNADLIERRGVGADRDENGLWVVDVGVDQQHGRGWLRDKVQEHAASGVGRGVACEVSGFDPIEISAAHDQVSEFHLMHGCDDSVRRRMVQRRVGAKAHDGGRWFGSFPTDQGLPKTIGHGDIRDGRRHQVGGRHRATGDAFGSVEILDRDPVAIGNLQNAIAERWADSRRDGTGHDATSTCRKERDCLAERFSGTADGYGDGWGAGQIKVDNFDLHAPGRAIRRAVQQDGSKLRRRNVG